MKAEELIGGILLLSGLFLIIGLIVYLFWVYGNPCVALFILGIFLIIMGGCCLNK